MRAVFSPAHLSAGIGQEGKIAVRVSEPWSAVWTIVVSCGVVAAVVVVIVAHVF